jgi:KipI family sensor histidine kinase inhibitor
VSGIEVRQAGERAVLLEFQDNAAAVRVARRLAADCPELEDVVPGHCTVLASWVGDSPREQLLALAEAALQDDEPAAPGAMHEIPTRYDGPDLHEVAGLTGLSPEEVATRHQLSEYVAGFLGFSPGFAYLLGGDERLHVPRRTEPRVRVPAGTVALGGVYSGVYPRESPGGWRLIGSTEIVLFDPTRDPPALLAAGDHVRFVAA